MSSLQNDTLKISSEESLTNGQRQGLPPVGQRHFFHSPLVTFYDDDILYFLSRLSYYSLGVLIKATFWSNHIQRSTRGRTEGHLVSLVITTDIKKGFA
jgi:hypothetical protein